MSFQTEAEKNALETNIVLLIDGEYFAKKQPDSGLVIPEENLIINNFKVNGVSVDIRRANTPIGSINFQFVDENEYITKKIMLDPNNFLEKVVQAFIGHVNVEGGFDFSEYVEISNVNIKNVTKIPNGYSIKANEATSLLAKEALNITGNLAINISDVSLSLDLEDITGFKNSGMIYTEGEYITYNGILDNTLQNLVRGELGSNAIDHAIGATIYQVTEVLGVNPIDIMLQIILSKEGDLVNHGTYDVLKNGLGIDPSKVDIARFESIRDSYFTGEAFDLYIYDMSNALKFLETELLQATNTRIYTNSGKISLAILDQVDIKTSAIELGEDLILRTPTWTLGSNKIVNKIIIKWDYNEGTNKYQQSSEFKDEDSITFFGEKPAITYSFKGVKQSLGGSAIVQNRGQRYLNRLSSPRGEISLEATLGSFVLNVGDSVLLTHRYLPKQGAGLGISDQLEVMSRSIDQDKGTLNFKLEYTSFTGLRVPFIAPSPKIISVTDQKTFEVPDGSCYGIGFALRLWNDTSLTYYPDPLNFIEEINGNIITMVNNFTTILTTDIRLKMSSYLDTVTEQQNRNAFIGNNGDNFEDNTKPYSILF